MKINETRTEILLKYNNFGAVKMVEKSSKKKSGIMTNNDINKNRASRFGKSNCFCFVNNDYVDFKYVDLDLLRYGQRSLNLVCLCFMMILRL